MSEHTARRWAPVLALAAALSTAACSNDVPSETPGVEVPGGNAMADERVSEDVKVTDVELPYPPDGVWEAGADVELQMAISNTGPTEARLVGVTGEGFTDVRDADGTTGVDLTIPAGETVLLGDDGVARLTLVGLTQSLRSAQAVPVTLEFADAGTVDVEATVSPEEPDPGDETGVPEPGGVTTSGG